MNDILKVLNDQHTENRIEGMATNRIKIEILLNDKGSISQLREIDEMIDIPHHKKRTSSYVPYFICEIVSNITSKQEYFDFNLEMLKSAKSKGLQAFKKFLRKGPTEMNKSLKKAGLAPEKIWAVFAYKGKWIHMLPEAIKIYTKFYNNIPSSKITCCISGKIDEEKEVHENIRKLGSPLFSKKMISSHAFGIKSLNVGKSAADNINYALNTLLDSKDHTVLINDSYLTFLVTDEKFLKQDISPIPIIDNWEATEKEINHLFYSIKDLGKYESIRSKDEYDGIYAIWVTKYNHRAPIMDVNYLTINEYKERLQNFTAKFDCDYPFVFPITKYIWRLYPDNEPLRNRIIKNVINSFLLGEKLPISLASHVMSRAISNTAQRKSIQSLMPAIKACAIDYQVDNQNAFLLGRIAACVQHEQAYNEVIYAPIYTALEKIIKSTETHPALVLSQLWLTHIKYSAWIRNKKPMGMNMWNYSRRIGQLVAKMGDLSAPFSSLDMLSFFLGLDYQNSIFFRNAKEKEENETLDFSNSSSVYRFGRLCAVVHFEQMKNGISIPQSSMFEKLAGLIINNPPIVIESMIAAHKRYNTWIERNNSQFAGWCKKLFNDIGEIKITEPLTDMEMIEFILGFEHQNRFIYRESR